MKVCNECGIEKDLAFFAVYRRNKKDGRAAKCKKCRHRLYSESQNIRRRSEKFRVAIRPRVRAYLARPEVRQRIRDRKRAARNWKTVLARRMSTSMRDALKGKKERKAWQELLGFSVSELRDHLEKQFSRGMGWHNMDKWDIDHIVPVSAFEITSPFDPDIQRCWALANLRPLWRGSNQSKHANRSFLV